MKNLKKFLLFYVFLFNLGFIECSFFDKFFCCKRKEKKDNKLINILNNFKLILKKKLSDNKFNNFSFDNNIEFKNQGFFYIDLNNLQMYENFENDLKKNFLKILKNELNLIVNLKNSKNRKADMIIFNIKSLNENISENTNLNNQVYEEIYKNSELIKYYKNNKTLFFSKIINKNKSLFFFIIFHKN